MSETQLVKNSINKIFAIERVMQNMPQIELKVVHHFSPGIYARELHIPAGVTLTGAVHRLHNLNILSSGEMTVVIDGEPKLINSPFTIISPPGTKRIATTHTDCVWTTIIHTNETDVEKIESMYVTNDKNECLSLNGIAFLEAQ